MKFGFNVFENPVEEYFDYAAEHGIKHLEIDLIKDHSRLATFDPKRIRNLKKLSKDYNINLSLHTPYTIRLGDNKLNFRKKSIDYLIQCVIIANQINATHITTHIGFFYGMPIWRWFRQRELKRLILSLEQVLKYCERYQVKLALENAVPKLLNSEFFFLGDNIDDFKFIFSKLNSQYLNMCLDIGHANTNEGALKYINEFGKKIINIHYHDNKGRNDDHLSIGEGNVPWKKVLLALKKIKFKGPYISECFEVEPHKAVKLLSGYF